MALTNLFEILADLPQTKAKDIMDFIVRYGKKRVYNPTENLVNEGEKSDCVYIILQGEVEILKKDNSGQMLSIAISKDGSIIGEMGVFLDMKRSATVRAKTVTIVSHFNNSTFLSALTQLPDLSMRLFKALALNIMSMNEKMASLIGIIELKALAFYIYEKEEC